MDYEELLRKLGFSRCGDTQIFQLSVGGAIGIHLEAANTLTVLELRDHVAKQLEMLATNIGMHIDGTKSQLIKATQPTLEKYADVDGAH